MLKFRMDTKKIGVLHVYPINVVTFQLGPFVWIRSRFDLHD